VCLYFRLIAQHLIGDSRYRNYSKDLHEDMVSAALEKCVKNIKNYNAEYADRCFNYYTRCCEHAIWTVLKKHYRQMNIRRELALAFADRLERSSPEAASRIRENQIEIEHTKDKITYKKGK